MRSTLAFLVLACLASSARADPIDDWCKTVNLPSSIAICSDPELRALTLERQAAYDQARAKLSPVLQKALLADQTAWVKSYPVACGLRQDAPPTLPLSPTIRDCMAQAGRARIAYLQTYAGLFEAGNPVPSATQRPTPYGSVPSSPMAVNCERKQHEYDDCLKAAVGAYWRSTHAVEKEAQRFQDEYQRRAYERALQLYQYSPEEVANSRCGYIKNFMFQMGCPE